MSNDKHWTEYSSNPDDGKTIIELINVKIQNLEAIIEKLESALKFYGDDASYDWESFDNPIEVVLIDDGIKARQALEEVKKLREEI